MGSWIGREGKGYQAWSTYSISPQSSIQASFRYAKIAKDFIPGEAPSGTPQSQPCFESARTFS